MTDSTENYYPSLSQLRGELSLRFRDLHSQLDLRELYLSEELEQSYRELKLKIRNREIDLLGLRTTSEILDSSICKEVMSDFPPDYSRFPRKPRASEINPLDSMCKEAVGSLPSDSNYSLKNRISELNALKFEVQLIWEETKIKNEINKIGQFSLNTIQNSFNEISDFEENSNFGDNSDCEENSDFEDNSVPIMAPNCDLQKGVIRDNLSAPLVKGDKWYLINIKWFKGWKLYVGFDDWDQLNVGLNIPGPIDNTKLIDKGGLSKMLVDGIDYKLLPEKTWNNFVSWYGQAKNSPALCRPVIEFGKFLRQLRVEIYPLELKSCLYHRQHDIKIIHISRCDTIISLYSKARTKFSISPNKTVKMYNRFGGDPYQLLSVSNTEIQNAGLFDGQAIMLDIMAVDGKWPKDYEYIQMDHGYISHVNMYNVKKRKIN